MAPAFSAVELKENTEAVPKSGVVLCDRVVPQQHQTGQKLGAAYASGVQELGQTLCCFRAQVRHLEKKPKRSWVQCINENNSTFQGLPPTSLSRSSESMTSTLWALSSVTSAFSPVAPVSASCWSDEWDDGPGRVVPASESSWKPKSSSRSMMARRALMRIFTSSS